MNELTNVCHCHGKQLIICVVSHWFDGGLRYEAKTTTPVGASEMLAHFHVLAMPDQMLWCTVLVVPG